MSYENPIPLPKGGDESIADFILNCADFVGVTANGQAWRLRKSIAGLAVGTVVPRTMLEAAFARTRRAISYGTTQVAAGKPADFNAVEMPAK